MREDVVMTRRGFGAALALGSAAATLAGRAALAAPGAPLNPGVHWERYASPEAGGFSAEALAVLEAAMYPQPTTSFMVVKGGKVVYTYGEVSQVSYLASSRKSVMSMLYGKYVASGVIDLNRTLADLKIDEGGGGLTEAEKQATIRDLLKSSSGVYWPAGSPGGDDSNTPARGSYRHGEHFHYNNWDFNVVGAIFEQLTGKTVFQALEEDLARPLQFEDFDRDRQRMLGYESNPSRYKAYHMFLSGRDMARLGLVMVNGGVWNGRQVIPAAWVKESTALYVKGADMGRDASSGYSYLWWKPSEGRRGPEWEGSYLANGNFGQYILALPAIDTVIVHRRAVTDEFAIARNTGRTKASPAGGSANFLALADLVVAARV